MSKFSMVCFMISFRAILATVILPGKFMVSPNSMACPSRVKLLSNSCELEIYQNFAESEKESFGVLYTSCRVDDLSQT